MRSTQQLTEKPLNGVANGHANGIANAQSLDPNSETTNRSRWRLLADSGRHTWHYLRTDSENEEWPQSTADKYFLGLPTVSQMAGFSIKNAR